MDLKELIRAKLKEKGLSEGLNVFIKAEAENEVDQAVNDLDEKIKTPDGFKGLLENIGLDAAYGTVLQSEGDKRVNQAIETYKRNHPSTDPPKPTQDPEPGKADPAGSDKEIQALKEQVKTLTDTITGQLSQVNTARLNDKIKASVKEAGLPESWANRVNVDSEDKIAETITELKTEHDSIAQSSIDEHLERAGLPKRGSADANITETAIKEFASEVTESDDSFPVQKL